MQKETDIIVVGSGIAGLSFAINIAKQRTDLRIKIITKAGLVDSNSYFAQGGIAAVMGENNDSFSNHIEDTIKCGGGFSNPDIVKFVIQNGPKHIHKLVDYGADFTRAKNGDFDLALEGGHSTNRVVHALDCTGKEVIKTLIRKVKSFPNIQILENHIGIELLKNDEVSVNGMNIVNLNTRNIETIHAKIVVMATGGLGQVFKYTTNPFVASGDAISMGIKAGALISNINYIQFHPTAFYEENSPRLFLLTEALRGFGAYVENEEGERFLFKSDKRGELATRDIVSKAIYKELNSSNCSYVYLNCKHLEKESFKLKFPSIYEFLVSKNIDISKDRIPIVPAVHYQCGGIKVNERGQTNLNGLYAIGECSDTGLHGANRLASNSLLEALVFAHESAEFILNTIDDLPFIESKPITLKLNSVNDEFYDLYTKSIQKVMSTYCTIASDIEDLKLAKIKLSEVEKIYKSKKNTHNQINLSQINLENILMISKLIVDEMLAKLMKYKSNKSFKTLAK